ncbi:MAG: hypothetical protein J2P48_08605 [Alphaproteobacteria bacterium]|nr:hypothetical protein [Alphaproteobacteria bacterium]
MQQAVGWAVYHLTSVAHPEDDRVPSGGRALASDAYLGHVEIRRTASQQKLGAFVRGFGQQRRMRPRSPS